MGPFSREPRMPTLRPETLDVLIYADSKIKELDVSKEAGHIDDVGHCRGTYRYSCMMRGALSAQDKDAAPSAKVCPEAYEYLKD